MSNETKFEMIEFDRQPTQKELDDVLKAWREGDPNTSKIKHTKEALEKSGKFDFQKELDKL